MCESILEILSVFIFFSDITYETLLRRGSFETKKSIFLFRCILIYFLLFSRLKFLSVRECVFCNKSDEIRRQDICAKVA